MTQELDMARLEAMTTEVQFADVVAVAPRFLEGKVRGRILVPVNLQLG
jgi:acrylyl-CoA reductase (NADPH)